MIRTPSLLRNNLGQVVHTSQTVLQLSSRLIIWSEMLCCGEDNDGPHWNQCKPIQLTRSACLWSPSSVVVAVYFSVFTALYSWSLIHTFLLVVHILLVLLVVPALATCLFKAHSQLSVVCVCACVYCCCALYSVKLSWLCVFCKVVLQCVIAPTCIMCVYVL